jgi:peptide/nickel transport system permease protein
MLISYCIRRVLYLIPVCLCVVSLVSVLIYLVPGDPADQILGELATLEQKEDLRNSLGLNQPLTSQIGSYFMGLARGDLGTSLLSQRPVLELVSERAPATLKLALASILIAILLAIPLGVLSAYRNGTWLDWSSMLFAMAGVAIPNFWLGPMLILLFSLYLGLLPVSGNDTLAHYVLPSITMGTALSAALSRMTRTAVLDNLNEQYVTTAFSKGLSSFRVMVSHVLKNSAIPVVTIIGLQFGALLTGAIITEKVFDWPGLGLLMLDAIEKRDYPVVQGLVLIFSATYLLVNLFTDVSYAVLDPRVRLEKK